ncbi:MAG: histidine phosphatase family protein [Chloroflexota bacterium]|nr:histidine phosphatase family protein [Chloroflexota bacterium]
MSRIYLVRHASPRVEPATPARAWGLSPRGLDEARRLAAAARRWGIAALYSSAEAKAAATAAIIGEALVLPVRLVEGLEEQRWDEWIDNADAFNDTVRQSLEDPDACVRGSEAASAAAARLDAALRIVAEGASPAAVVSHGRVLAAYLARAVPLDDPYAFWRAMPMPGYACIERAPDGRVRLIEGFRGADDGP